MKLIMDSADFVFYFFISTLIFLIISIKFGLLGLLVYPFYLIGFIRTEKELKELKRCKING